MSAVSDMVAALDAGNFDSVLDGAMGGLDKAGLTKLAADMKAAADGIADADKRHLFKNGIASVEMTMNSM